MELKLLTLLLPLIFTVGCTSQPEPVLPPKVSPPAQTEAAPAPAAPTLRIVTYNINWGCPNPNLVAQHLLESGADVICLQETHQRWESLLDDHLSDTYPHGTFHDWGGAGGIAIISKYPLHNVRLLKPQAGWFPALITETTTDIGPVQILNVHLRPPLDDDAKATVSAYLESSTIHHRELTHFLQSANRDQPLIIAGDFNENERRTAIKKLLNDGFTDALSLYDTKSNTWSWRTASGITLQNRYDHILFNQHFHCTDAKVADVRASDHRPVQAVLINNKQDTEQDIPNSR